MRPDNIGYMSSDGHVASSWRVIDAGCFGFAGGELYPQDMWPVVTKRLSCFEVAAETGAKIVAFIDTVFQKQL